MKLIGEDITVINKFFEYNLSSETEYDKYYYLVLRLDKKTIKNLVRGEFKGLKGISNNIKIIPQFFDIRDILLVMDKKSTDEINDLESVKYDDLDFLTKDSFENLKRLYDTTSDSIESLLYQGFRKHTYKLKKDMTDRLSKLDKKINIDHYLTTNSHHKMLTFLDRQCWEILEPIKKVKDFEDFINQVYRVIDKLKLDLDKKIVKEIYEYIILSFSAMFKKEGEIIVNSQSFKVPDGSILLIKEQYDGKFGDDFNFRKNEKEELFNKHKDALNKKYKIKFLPYKSGNMTSTTHLQSYPIVRYLDKIKTFDNF